MSTDIVVSNPFRQTAVAPTGINPRTNSEIQTATHEIAFMQARVTRAIQRPRDPASAYDDIMTACQRVELAKVSTYTYSRGGSSISGPSIRLAEEVARIWGNIDHGWSELERRNGESVVRTYAWDMETNVCKTLIFVVPLVRSTKMGNKQLTDERDIYEHIANHAARRLRQCILSLIPADVIDDAVTACEKTLTVKVDITPERVKKMAEEFGKIGVTKQQIEGRIQRKLETVTPAQFLRLGEIFNSIRDGMSEASDWFDADKEESAKLKLEKTVELTKESAQ